MVEWHDVKRKPVVVQAFQLTMSMRTTAELDGIKKVRPMMGLSLGHFKVYTFEGAVFPKVGDWIIKGVKGEIYPCQKDIFEETYKVLR